MLLLVFCTLFLHVVVVVSVGQGHRWQLTHNTVSGNVAKHAIQVIGNSNELIRSLKAGPTCPEGFVVPDDPSSPDNIYINRTESICAQACRSPAYTSGEWNQMEHIADIAVYLGLPMGVLFIYTYFFNYEKRMQYLVRIFGVLSLIHSIMTAIVQSVPYEKRICRNNANSLGPSDGFTLCAVQAVVQLYCGLAVALCWLLQAIAVFVKVVLGWRNVGPRRTRHMFVIFGLPLISVAIMIASKSYGYTRTSFGCFFNSSVKHSKMDIYIFFIPLTIICLIGLVLLVAVMIKMAMVFGEYYRVHRRKIHVETTRTRTRSRSRNDSLTDTPSRARDQEREQREEQEEMERQREREREQNNMTSDSEESSEGPAYESVNNMSHQSVTETVAGAARTLGQGLAGVATASVPAQLQELDLQSMWDLVIYFRTPMVFLVFFLVVYLTTVAGGWSTSKLRARYSRSLTEFGQCALDNYNGVDSSWHEVCGKHPALRVPLSARKLFAFVFAGQSVFLSIIYSRSVVVFMYSECLALGRVIRYCVMGPQEEITEGENDIKQPSPAAVALALPETAPVTARYLSPGTAAGAGTDIKKGNEMVVIEQKPPRENDSSVGDPSLFGCPDDPSADSVVRITAYGTEIGTRHDLADYHALNDFSDLNAPHDQHAAGDYNV